MFHIAENPVLGSDEFLLGLLVRIFSWAGVKRTEGLEHYHVASISQKKAQAR